MSKRHVKKLSPNEQLVNRLMMEAQAGRIMQAFIIEAISIYSQLVSNDPGKWNPAPINPNAWKAMADECTETLDKWSKEVWK